LLSSSDFHCGIYSKIDLFRCFSWHFIYRTTQIQHVIKHSIWHSVLYIYICGILFDIPFGILSDIPFFSLSNICSDILFYMWFGSLSARFWHSGWYFSWHMIVYALYSDITSIKTFTWQGKNTDLHNLQTLWSEQETRVSSTKHDDLTSKNGYHGQIYECMRGYGCFSLYSCTSSHWIACLRRLNYRPSIDWGNHVNCLSCPSVFSCNKQGKGPYPRFNWLCAGENRLAGLAQYPLVI